MLNNNTFDLEDLTEPTRRTPFANPQSASNSVSLDMPGVDMKSSLGKRIEVYDNDSTSWLPWIVRKIVVDGRVQLQSVLHDAVVKWV